MSRHVQLNRRELLSAILGASFVAATPGCGRRRLPPKGELLAPEFQLGHRLRDGQLGALIQRGPTDWQPIDCVVVGGGMAGLSAAWQLQRGGLKDFVVLELESELGGTARSGQRGGFSYPWGAHYVPAPMAHHTDLIELLDEMGVVEAVDPQGTPQFREQFLCREPEERLFIDGRWVQGLYPAAGATADDLAQLERFRGLIDDWVSRRDSQGRRMFAIPMAAGSDADEVRQLDSISMQQWMDQHSLTSERLRWLVDYACRDDYGLKLDQASAWAGLFYFASRQANAGEDSQPVITWPAGNGQIVNHLAAQLSNHATSPLRPAHAVVRVEETAAQDRVRVMALDTRRNQLVGFEARRVIFAAPQFLASHVVAGFSAERNSGSFEYGAWVVANVHLSDRPRDIGFPCCWDNVLYHSNSLGYVVSTHQTGSDHGPTVLTWYYPMTAATPALSRQQLLSLDWQHWAEVVLSDLEIAHPEIRSLTTRLDVMRWGHAMVQPRPGFVWSSARQNAALPLGRVHFAGTDLSGIALMEEAFYHGLRGAREVLAVS